MAHRNSIALIGRTSGPSGRVVGRVEKVTSVVHIVVKREKVMVLIIVVCGRKGLTHGSVDRIVVELLLPLTNHQSMSARMRLRAIVEPPEA